MIFRDQGPEVRGQRKGKEYKVQRGKGAKAQRANREA